MLARGAEPIVHAQQVENHVFNMKTDGSLQPFAVSLPLPEQWSPFCMERGCKMLRLLLWRNEQ